MAASLAQEVADHVFIDALDPRLPAPRRPCPVCHGPLPAGATHCSRVCSVRAQLADLATAAAAEAESCADDSLAVWWRGRLDGLQSALHELEVLDDVGVEHV